MYTSCKGVLVICRAPIYMRRAVWGSHLFGYNAFVISPQTVTPGPKGHALQGHAAGFELIGGDVGIGFLFNAQRMQGVAMGVTDVHIKAFFHFLGTRVILTASGRLKTRGRCQTR